MPELDRSANDGLKPYLMEYRFSGALSLFRFWLSRGKDLRNDRENLNCKYNKYRPVTWLYHSKCKIFRYISRYKTGAEENDNKLHPHPRQEMQKC